jgi:hypothetical protein
MGMQERILNASSASYSSNLSLENLKQKISNLNNKKTLPFSGKLQSENEFSVYDKRNVIGWNNPDVRRKSAYLNGKFSQSETGALVYLIIKPNSFLPVFAIVSVIIGIIFALIASFIMNNDNFLFMISLIFIVLGVFYYPFSTYFRNRLQNNIVKYLDLQKL